MKKRRKQHSKRPILLLVCFLVIFGIGVLGKYVHNTYEKTLVEAEKFIFVSSYDVGETYLYTNQGQSASVTIQIFNHEVGQITPSNIKYGVTVQDITDEQHPVKVTTFTDSANGELDGGRESSSDITLTGLQLGHKYQVNIVSTDPYTKELTTSFHVLQKESTATYYEIEKHDTWCQLDVFVGSVVPEQLVINYTGLAPDNTNDIMEEWTASSGTGTITADKLNAYSTYSFIFFGSPTGGDVDRREVESGTITVQ